MIGPVTAVLLIFGIPAMIIVLIHDNDAMDSIGDRVWLSITKARREHNKKCEVWLREYELKNKYKEIKLVISEAERRGFPTDALEMSLSLVKHELKQIKDVEHQKELEEFNERYIKAIEGN